MLKGGGGSIIGSYQNKYSAQCQLCGNIDETISHSTLASTSVEYAVPRDV